MSSTTLFSMFSNPAQDGFARLMGLKDTSPLSTEMDGLDSGLGEAPPTCDKKMCSPLKPENVSLQPAFILDEDHQLDLQKPSKKKAKKDSESDKILGQRQKKSLEKVAEWLMKVPSEQSLELENPEEDGDDSDSCSSTSTIDLGQLHCETNPTRSCAKALEDQVFGAIYRRERRAKEIVKPIEVALERVCFNLSVKDTSEDKNGDEKEEENLIREQEKNTSSNILKGEIGVLGDCRGILEPTLTSETDKNKKDEVPHLVSVIEEQQPETKVKRKTRSTLQHIGTHLLTCMQKMPENTEQKRSMQRGSRSIKSEKAKSGRKSKPLVLVRVENVEASPEVRPRSEEVQVHIENCPSSDDQEVPVGRRSRRSRRLQVCTKEDNKKEKSRSSIPEKEQDSKYPHFEFQILDNGKSPDDKEQKLQAERNGCIYSQDIAEIENMVSGEKTSLRAEGNTKQALSEVPNTETLLHTACSVTVVPSSAETALEESTKQPPNTLQFLTELADIEREQKNDSEQETEQLVKSFRATKRKSFHLGSGPDIKRSRLLVQENNQSAGAEENVCSADQSAPKHVEPVKAEITDNQILFDSHNMSEGGDCVSASSPLPPNLESKHVVQGSCPVIPTEGDSAICFPTEKPSQLSEIQADFVMENTRSSTSHHSISANTPQELFNAESSWTPNGLEMPVPNREATVSQGSRELSSCRKRTKAQKLDSSSDSSDCAEEEFPCLAKIFNKTAPPGDHVILPPACPSPDCLASSQASVDLFGTPNECKFIVSGYLLNYQDIFFMLLVVAKGPTLFFSVILL